MVYRVHGFEKNQPQNFQGHFAHATNANAGLSLCVHRSPETVLCVYLDTPRIARDFIAYVMFSLGFMAQTKFAIRCPPQGKKHEQYHGEVMSLREKEWLYDRLEYPIIRAGSPWQSGVYPSYGCFRSRQCDAHDNPLLITFIAGPFTPLTVSSNVAAPTTSIT